jgi:membrane dipeptidase
MPEPIIIVDAHQDIAYNQLAFGRDYRESAYHKRQLEAHAPHLEKSGTATLGLPDNLLGRVAIAFATLFVAPRRGQLAAFEPVTYSNPREAHDQAMRQWDYYQRLADEDSRIDLVRSSVELDAVLSTWQDGQPIDTVRQGLVLLMEGADPILEPQQFEEWYARGVRIVGPAWEQTRYAGGTGYPGGLTRMGYELLDIMAGFNVALDLSHMAEQAFLQALEAYSGETVLASHSNPRRFVDTDRHLSDTMIRLLAERDGVIGIVLYNTFLQAGWRKSDLKSAVPYARVIDAIDYICQLTGSAAHVGIGSDLDGGFGLESIPVGFDTAADLWSIGTALRERGYDRADVAAVLGGNMLRKLRQVLP